MNLLRKYVRGLLAEQEERSDLEKLQDVFISNGAQAVELGEMILPNSPEVKNMRKVVDATKNFLKTFENPSFGYRVRQHERDLWNREMTALINDLPKLRSPILLTRPYNLTANVQKHSSFGPIEPS